MDKKDERIMLLACRDELKKRIVQDAKMPEIPKTVVVLGSGLSNFKDNIEVMLEIPYREIPCFHSSTVEGHGNSLIIGYSNNIPIIAMNGRFHYYEGIDMEDIAFPIKAFKMLGVENLVLSAAVGGINPNLKPGNIMVINDHIKFFDENPLRGYKYVPEKLGPQFPDMSETYKVANIREDLKKYFEEELKVPYMEGVYAFMPGPSYETPAEIKMLSVLGADVVGMSTVPEAITANYCGINVYAFAAISNMAAGISETKLNHEEVIENGKLISDTFTKVVSKTLELIH